MKKDMVIGLGEIGLPIYKIISKHFPVEGIDINPILNKEKPSLKNHDVAFIHFCIPFSKNFFNIIKKYEKKIQPEAIVIHSTISPKTTEKLQKMIKSPVIYSATRGVHKRMISDLKRYTKFYSVCFSSPSTCITTSSLSLLSKKVILSFLSVITGILIATFLLSVCGGIILLG